MSPESGARVAFYDFDGTLVSGNVVTRYGWIARRHPSRWVARWRYAKAWAWVPVWLLLDSFSRRLFNVVFFRQYRGLREDWLRAQGRELFEACVKREQFRFALERLALDRKAGYHTVLVSGGLDFALAPVAEYFGFDAVLANRLEYRNGVASGEIVPPLLANEEKAIALKAYAREHGFDLRLAKAYSDSASDLPMLEAVGRPVAANPNKRLRKAALARGWEIVDLARSPYPIEDPRA